MGNVHSVLQIEPRYFEGAAIEIPRGHWEQLGRLHADRPHHVPNVLIKEFEDDFWVFCDEPFHELRRFLVVQDAGKSGYEEELPELMEVFAPCLEDAEFYVDDEYQGYVERFRTVAGKLEVERVVESDGEAFEYLDGALADRTETHLRLLVGKAGALMRLADSWIRHGAQEAAREDRERALDLFHQAAELHSMNTSPLALTNEAVTLLQLDRPAEAASACRQALKRASGVGQAANALYNLACALSLTGQRDEALKSLWAAVQLQPAFAKSAAEDQDFLQLRSDPEFRELIGS